MRKIFPILLSLVTAALVGPVVFLGTAVTLDRLGFPALANRVECLPFNDSMGQLLGEEATPLWLTVTTGAILTAFLFIAGLLLCFRRRNGQAIIALCGVSVIPIYVHLALDESPVEFRLETLQPNSGSARIPREIVLEATNDPTFGHAKDWPKTLFEFHKETPSKEWLLENAEQIRSRWAQLKPVRAWAARLDDWPSFDDYIGKLTDPVLAFQPFRQMTMGAQELALLCCAEGKPEEAAGTIREMVRLGRHLENGSRALVTLMIGAVIEKTSLRTLQTLCERDPDSRELYRKSLEDSQPISPWADFERTLLNEIALGSNSIKETYSGGKNLKERAANYMTGLLVNQNASTRIYRVYVEQVIASAKRGDFESIERMDAVLPGKSPKRAIKNLSGRYLVRQGLPAFEKVAKSLEELATLRTQLAAPTTESPPAL